MPGGGHTGRVPRLRETAADRLDVLRGALAGAADWRDAEARARARAAVRAVAGRRAGDGLAISHLAGEGAREVLLHRPSAARGAPVVDAELLTRAAATGRGVVVSFCHFGPFAGLGVSLAPHVPRLHMVTGAWLADPPPGIPQPPRRDRWRALFDAAGVALVNAEDGGGERIRALLAGGQVVAITFDWPGSVETPFLGRPTWLASGSARLAADTGALIVPAMRRWRRLRPQTVVAPPLDPRDHADWRALHERLAAVHSHWIAQRPAALEDPRRPGAWEATATADAWGPLPHRQS